eukprot:GEZU01029609.1.p2 GENE.GEZU01029609.1~~GEZU01029609.1.p2  ORF type:complete len:395 (-),score=174.91 GEZU01029609.1:394-1578(-)
MSKKAPEPEPITVLGRVGTNLQVGLVGLPNVGKSTLFNVLTKSCAPAENFPFCTIDPNHSRVAVPDERFDFLVNYFKPASAVPAFLQITDIAGLVKGASEGQGLGNAFLSHIRAVDAIFHIVRVFEDEDVSHVEGNVDPTRDLEIITKELLLKDIEFVEQAHEKIAAVVKRAGASAPKDKKEELATVEKVLEHLRAGKEVRTGQWKAAEIEILNTMQLLTAKPVIYLVNMTPADYIRKKNKWLPKIKEWIDARTKEPLIPFSATMESKLADMTPEDAQKFLAENKVTSQLPKMIKQGYHSLHLCHFFTAGTDEVKCWTIRVGMTAPQAAGKIHTDFEKGFICAEVMAFEDFKALGSEAAVRNAGKYKQQGKNYVVQDGDMILFKFNVTAQPKKK